MAKRIEDLLHRRNDLSTFLVHLTRDADGETARDNLLNILVTRELEARTPMGLGSAYFENEEFAATQRMVCFTETPLEHVWMMCEEIEFRTVTMAPYGVVFTKTWARRRGVNPVMYIDITAGHNWLTGPLNQMLDVAHAGHAIVREGDGFARVDLAHSPIAALTPFLEPMGRPGNVRREWWWEREWRHRGNLFFQWWDLVAVFVPQDDHAAFAESFDERLAELHLARPPDPLRYLDPRWGQERMIATFAGVTPDNVGPFPA